MNLRKRNLGSVLLLSLLSGSASSQSFLLDLQGLPISDEFTSEAFAISGDGTVLAGRGTPAQRAWRLDDQFNTVFLGDQHGGGDLSTAYGLSRDGSVVVGQVHAFNGPEAFRWTPQLGYTLLGDLPGGMFESGAYDVTPDGTTIVGYGISPGGTLTGAEAFIWRLTNPQNGSGTMVGLGDLPGGDTASIANAVSHGGNVVVGASSSARSNAHSLVSTEAFRWTMTNQQTGEGRMVGLGDLAGGGFSSWAIDVSADGNVVVGQGLSANGPEAFYWRDGQMIGLGDLPGGNHVSVANAVSADGSIVVGQSAVAIGDGGHDVFRPFIWDAENGMRDLIDVFAANGLALPNLHLTNATDISEDGRTITGFGTSRFRIPAGDLRTEAWIGRLDIPVVVPPVDGDVNQDGVVDAADITELSRAIRRGADEPGFDMNQDGRVDTEDRRFWVEELANTYFGDSNLDGEFGSGDLVTVFAAGEYEDAIVGNSTWATGDWDGDGDFTTGDLVIAFGSGGFELGPRPAASSVPEPTAMTLLATMMLALLSVWRDR